MAPKLHGRAFYESIGSPKMILAPMVDQSEFAWRMLSRSFMTPETNKDLLAYSPMLHARLFANTAKYRESHFQPTRGALPSPPPSRQASPYTETDLYLDGHTKTDRPLFVQFCANNPDELLAAAQHVQPFCDAVDLNLGCPQGIAKKGHYGAFLQEDWDTIYKLINKLHEGLDVPVTAKMRVLETKEKTLEYAQTILRAGASIITVHGRRREQKGHNTGLADWKILRYLREQLPPETVIFANGNILHHEDIEQCLAETGADGVMSAEGNLHDPSIFAKPPPVGEEGREYWRGRDGKGGYRMDAVFRRYMDIIHRDVLGQDPPERKPLFLVSDARNACEESASRVNTDLAEEDQEAEDGSPPKKKQKRQQEKTPKMERTSSPNLVAMQGHLFHMLRTLVSKHHNVRDALARSRAGDIAAFENVLTLVEAAVKEGLLEYEIGKDETMDETSTAQPSEAEANSTESSLAAVARCKRPYFICQPYVRPLPKEALEKGALQMSKKEKARLAKDEAETKEAGLTPGGKVGTEQVDQGEEKSKVEVAGDGLVCG